MFIRASTPAPPSGNAALRWARTGQLLHTWYGNNNGDILGTAKVIMADFYNHIPAGCTIGHVTTTGYGEALLIEALKADSGEIETVAHLRGAKAFLPGVEFILDIGGQDMKCLARQGRRYRAHHAQRGLLVGLR